MTEFNIWLLLMPFAVVILIFSLGILFVRKKFRLWFKRFSHGEKAIDIIIITQNRNLFHGVVSIEDDKFKYKSQEYIIDEKCIYTEKFKLAQRPYSIYIEGNPKPIHFDFKKLEPDISSVDLKNITQSKLIEKLLETKEEFLSKLSLIISGVVLVAVLVGMYLLFKRIDTLSETIVNMRIP